MATHSRILFFFFLSPFIFTSWRLITLQYCSGFCILAWRIPWVEEPGGLQSIRSRRVGHDSVTQHAHTQWMNAVLQWMKAAELPMFRIFKMWPKMFTLPWELKKTVNWCELGVLLGCLQMRRCSNGFLLFSSPFETWDPRTVATTPLATTVTRVPLGTMGRWPARPVTALRAPVLMARLPGEHTGVLACLHRPPLKLDCFHGQLRFPGFPCEPS